MKNDQFLINLFVVFKVPQQKNAFDCGVFLLMFVENIFKLKVNLFSVFK